MPGNLFCCKWKLAAPPVDTVLPLYKLTYMTCKCPKKFDKIWGAWVKARPGTFGGLPAVFCKFCI